MGSRKSSVLSLMGTLCRRIGVAQSISKLVLISHGVFCWAPPPPPGGWGPGGPGPPLLNHWFHFWGGVPVCSPPPPPPPPGSRERDCLWHIDALPAVTGSVVLLPGWAKAWRTSLGWRGAVDWLCCAHVITLLVIFLLLNEREVGD